jgi:hypothetical protein
MVAGVENDPFPPALVPQITGSQESGSHLARYCLASACQRPETRHEPQSSQLPQKLRSGRWALAGLPSTLLGQAIAGSTEQANSRRPIPVILATDIGDDIDDTWALGFLLKCPELDLKLVATEYGKAQYRAKLLAKFLQTTGHAQIPVAIGPEPGRVVLQAVDG